MPKRLSAEVSRLRRVTGMFSTAQIASELVRVNSSAIQIAFAHHLKKARSSGRAKPPENDAKDALKIIAGIQKELVVLRRVTLAAPDSHANDYYLHLADLIEHATREFDRGCCPVQIKPHSKSN